MLQLPKRSALKISFSFAKIHFLRPAVKEMFLLSMPGAPFIYYGDEIGMNYVENLVSVEGGYGRTGSRSPMQWDSSTNEGFSSAPADKLYIPLDPGAKRPTVQTQQQNKKSLYHEIQKLIKIRQEHEALQSRGQIEFIFANKNEYPLAYVRSCEKCEASGANSSAGFFKLN